jgi:excisionase family DNA binding protein
MTQSIALRPWEIAEAESQFEPLLTTEEAATHLRIHTKTLQRIARAGSVPCVRLGKYWRFRLSALDLWVRSHENQDQPAFPREVIGRKS